ncbi:isoprenylcysteine carboxyl methyltransferase family protein [Campylobacter mucosalis]|uniref:isoprenylcysteine carboxyl methyltransferase family protein n=1 Tax=Campylobacter mucosalis TaxID=202 RepID=UPI0005570920|nr:isoprenylcysteine carboxyl methyltransferase family protein [Campylobacter mucosalis]QKF62469.1 isoprenylcysteine carboxyl methyltransferase family protein [Campylobacter mucosalis]
MDYLVYVLVVSIFILRLGFLKISKQNESLILQNGGVEYGVKNTKMLTIAHILFYLGCLIEAIMQKQVFDGVSLAGTFLIVFAFLMLYYIVNYLLKGIWTVKLMVANNHKYNPHWLFKVVKHPNYYLNILPELIGLAMLCHAKVSFIVIMPIYLVILFIRIKEEDRVLKEIIIPNGVKTN